MPTTISNVISTEFVQASRPPPHHRTLGRRPAWVRTLIRSPRNNIPNKPRAFSNWPFGSQLDHVREQLKCSVYVFDHMGGQDDCWTMQPYADSPSDELAIREACDRLAAWLGLNYEISREDSTWNPPRTVLIRFWPARWQPPKQTTERLLI